jgi:hypothetical protein
VRIKRPPCFRLGKPEQGSTFLLEVKERIPIKTEEPRRRKTPQGRAGIKNNTVKLAV